MIDWLEQHLFACAIRSTLGMDCPGCGMQRAFIALLRGDLPGSFRHHAALLPFLAMVIALLVQLKIKHVNGGKWVMWLFILTSAVTFVQFVYRLSA